MAPVPQNHPDFNEIETAHQGILVRSIKRVCHSHGQSAFPGSARVLKNTPCQAASSLGASQVQHCPTPSPHPQSSSTGVLKPDCARGPWRASANGAVLTPPTLELLTHQNWVKSPVHMLSPGVLLLLGEDTGEERQICEKMSLLKAL